MSYQNVITFFKLKNAQEVLILFFNYFHFFIIETFTLIYVQIQDLWGVKGIFKL